MMKVKLHLLFLFAFLLSCGNPIYKGGGFGGLSGDGNSTVTISGYVMSTATFQSTSSQLAGLEGGEAFEHSFSAMLAAADDPTPLIGGVENVVDACVGAPWSMIFVGGGGGTAGSGYSAADGSFAVPSIPNGKEALITFNCSGVTQKCLVKAGDAGITCNSISDGVVGALEASLGKELSNSDLAGKSIAKVASSIVESAKTDNSDSQSLKESIAICKVMPMNTLAELQEKKDCYKNSLEASSMSGTLDVVKTLAQQWTIRNLFNFVAASAGYNIRLDSMIYTDFGASFDNWLGTDFVAGTRNYISDLISNPEYIEGDVTKGDQVVKIECSMWYNKGYEFGKANYKPVLETINGIPNVPSCNNLNALVAFTGLSSGDAKLTTFRNTISNDHYQQTQVGSSSSSCPSNGSNDFCLSTPSLTISSRVREANRNDITGTKVGDNEFQPEVSLIEVFSEVHDLLNKMILDTAPTTNTYHSCISEHTPRIDNSTSCNDWAQGLDSSGAYTTCFNEINSQYTMNISSAVCNAFVRGILNDSDDEHNSCIRIMSDGPPPFNLTTAQCRNWTRDSFLRVRGSFGGMMGLYMYLKNPSSYSSGGSAKLSLNDIHKIFSLPDFINAKLTAFAPGYSWARSGNSNGDIDSPPILDMSNPATPMMQNVFLWNGSTPSVSTLSAAIALGDLSALYNVTFAMFEKIPTTQQVRSYVENASHHEEWNPYGSKYANVAGMNESGTIYPIYCKMLNRNKRDAAGEPMATEKELSASTKIECLSNPGTASASVKSKYPYLLQGWGWNGDSKGNIFALADGKTGNVLRIAGKEILILEAKGGNGSWGCQSAPSDTKNDPAPIVRPKLKTGFGDFYREEVIDAYCLNMTGLLVSDPDTRLRFGGEFPLTYIDNSGHTQSYKIPQLGGPSEAVCLYTDGELFDSTTYGGWTLNGTNSSGYSTSTFTSNTYTQNIITAGAPSARIDLCDSTSHSSLTMYYLTHFYDDQKYYGATAGTNPNHGARSDKPIGLIHASSGKQIYNWFISLGALEALDARTQANGGTNSSFSMASNDANGTPTWAYNYKFLNQKHNPKYDPYCDDLDNDGCDCFQGNTTIIKDRSQSECTLSDSAAEPTISQPLYHPEQSDGALKKAFLAQYGGKWGSQLKWDHDDDTGTPTVPLDRNFFGPSGPYGVNSNQGIDFPESELFTCYYLADGETEYRTPTSVFWPDLTNMHMDGCPDSNGDLIASSDSIPGAEDLPDTGGGPIRIVNPKPMQNAYDIARPKTLLSMISYASKTVGQGAIIGQYEKAFTFDEALALVAVRLMLPPQGMRVYGTVNATTVALDQATANFYPVRPANGNDFSAISSILRGITRPDLIE
ncbi:MAG: hypothetical protein ACOYL6_08070 [Bacteriovoracaceae bacterium]